MTPLGRDWAPMLVLALLGCTIGLPPEDAVEVRESSGDETPVFERAPGAALALGGSFACAINRQGRVACWGHGSRELEGENDRRYPPTLLDGPTDVLEIVVTTRGETDVLCSRGGANDVLCMDLGTCRRDGVCDPIAREPAVVDVHAAIALAATSGRACGVDPRGEVRCWELSEEPPPSGGYVPTAFDVAPARALAFLDRAPCLLALDGALTCGSVRVGELAGDDARLVASEGDRSVVCAWAPGVAPACWSLVLLARGGDGRLPMPEDLGFVRSIALGASSTCAVTDEGALRCWRGWTASDASVELGAMEPVDAGPFVEVAARGALVCARREDGRVACRGPNDAGQLGREPVWHVAEPRRIEGLPPIARLAAAPATVCAIATGGEAWCWGDGRATPTRLEEGTGIADLVVDQGTAGLATEAHVATWTTERAVVLAAGIDGRVRYWPDLTRAPTILDGVRDAERVGFGDGFVAIRRNGTLVRWGAPDAAPEPIRTGGGARAQARGCVLRRDGRLDWGEAPQAPLERTRGIDELAVGGGYACTRAGASVECAWIGWSGEGPAPRFVLDVGAGARSLARSRDQTCVVAASGTVHCARDGAALDEVPGTAGAADIALGWGFGCLRTTEGEVRCWGSNAYEAIGIPLGSDTLVDVPLPE